MCLRHKLARLFIGADPQLRRMLGYWAATGVFYTVCLGLMLVQIRAGTADRAPAIFLCWLGMSSVLGCYVLIRVSRVLRILPAQLAVLQALIALGCNVAAYAISGPVRGASLMVLLVVIVFCTFSLRPRATLALCAGTIVALGATIGWHVIHDPLHFPAQLEAVHFGLAAASLLTVSLLTGEMSKLRVRLSRQKEALLAAVATIRTLATIDELTALANRRHMNDVLGEEERRTRARGQPVCIALLDIDFFKRVNDRYGHAGGDAVLRSFAAAARAGLRDGDVLARWGGEEFLLMLPDTCLAAATAVLARIAANVGAMRVGAIDADAAPITFSAGVAERGGGEPFADTISRADRAMYIAKSSGRNQIVPIAAEPGAGVSAGVRSDIRTLSRGQV
ncbi:MAG: diguanylate cyclase [Pseudomonadota bacterium]|nr:diguanylate cyclase [Pseudomonadota bacterium]